MDRLSSYLPLLAPGCRWVLSLIVSWVSYCFPRPLVGFPAVIRKQWRNNFNTHFPDLIILFLFSRRFNLSTRLRCIFSASFSYRSFSALATRLSLIPCIHRYCCG